MAHVLVVDDDPQVASAVVRCLEPDGHAVLTAPSAAEARLVLGREQIDVVVCDVRLEGESGLDLVRQITAELPDTAVFMLTGVEDPAVAREALSLGATAYVVKPFTQHEVRINVANSVRLRDLERDRRRLADQLEEKLVDRTRALSAALDELTDLGVRAHVAGHEVVDRLVAALTLRDDETGAHIQRMSRYTAILARERGQTVWPLEALQLGALLHDVGKIGIPDGILLKPGPLSDREREVMRRHAELGFRLLVGGDADVLRLGATMAWCHHERWDGQGYPRGLAGEAIPLEGRLAAVTDVFDALTSNRVYRPALEIDQAVELLEAGRGTQFDPELVGLFVGVLDEILAIRDEYRDPEPLEGIRVLLVDDHSMFAESVARVIAREPGIELVGVTGTVASAVDEARRHRPDVVIMDWQLPDGDGAEATGRIRQELPATRVLMLTGRSDDAVLIEALRAGCAGFLTKHESFEKLAEMVRAVHAGESTLPAGRLVSLLGRIDADQRGGASTLTQREIEVLDLVAQGLSVEAIAGKLFLSIHTVRNHIQSTITKLGAHSRLEAVTIGVRQGIIRFA